MEDVSSSTHHYYDTRHLAEKLTRLEEDFADMKKVLKEVQLSLLLNQPKPEAKQVHSSSSLNQPKPQAKQVQSIVIDGANGARHRCAIGDLEPKRHELGSGGRLLTKQYRSFSSLNQPNPQAKQVQSSSSLNQPKPKAKQVQSSLSLNQPRPKSKQVQSSSSLNQPKPKAKQNPTYGYISPVFKKPDRPYTNIFYYALAIGFYIFIIRELMYTNGDMIPSRAIFYRDTQKHKDEWQEAPPLRGETHSYCFFQANDKILLRTKAHTHE
ncbi:unnamed protein product [Cuscuta campestris]|uniref:Uncharacterized protein n=1 Tax=Cuscuta campestris TaxID=132261 RepID=A0A484MUU9_9ASTE|nr:unnamed protein product [Cuscuta campestris]